MRRPKPQPTPEQVEALRQFAAKYGPRWKLELQLQWQTGADDREPNSHLLRQVRNQCGPKWLGTFKL